MDATVREMTADDCGRAIALWPATEGVAARIFWSHCGWSAQDDLVVLTKDLQPPRSRSEP